MDDIEIFKTQDGSIGLFDKKLNEVYHSKFGAKTESFEKFVEPALILNNRPLKILDICFGIGYNTKMALSCFKDIIQIDCVEINKNLALKSSEFEFDEKINQIIKENLIEEKFIHFYFEDIRKVIKDLDSYDIIFHDGFSPTKQATTWSKELIFEISKHLKSDGLYLTYNHSKPVLNALSQAGLILGKTIKENKTIGTIAGFKPKLILNPLTEFELGQLKTKSAITYKDKNLNLDNETIILNRKKEVEKSDLMTLSSYLKLNS